MEERITLIDFGIARFKNLPTHTLVAGSPSYMAPEQHDNPSAQCDIYALSLVAFELFTGHLPKPGQNISAQLPRGLGRRVISANLNGLRPEPSERFAEVSKLVEELLAEQSGVERVTAPAIAGVLVLAAAGYFFWFRPTQVRSEYSRPVPIVSTPAFEHEPAFSPDGSEIYYAAGEAGSRYIYKKALTGADPVLVVGHSGHAARPQVSPDGKELVFLRGSSQTEIVKRNLRDGGETVLAVGVDVDTYSWTPDGKRLVLSGRVEGALQKLQVLQIESRKLETLELLGAPDCGLYHPRVSPMERL